MSKGNIMQLDYYCQFELLPDADGCVNVLLFLVLVFGFIHIVLINKKYKFMLDYFMDRFGKYF
ncbi:hypothetical protein [Candidatus Sulfurimonas baltica]|uniref:Uncharacterized protein n=1 Tax=Candidatus Sulfurimonas baltica TaxID=2740404 RepID=A0A7S7RND6_9BACT|nr:hypothetical protein [Candidatus Sulfurimonas baltica]QOY53202.1 hypothetical protein HUE88_05855 [Candidatus Sulfurimonas baltica]